MRTMLVVYDERLTRDLLQALLVAHGHDLLTAASDLEAVRLFQQHC